MSLEKMKQALSVLYNDDEPLSKRGVRQRFYRDRINVLGDVDRKLCQLMFGEKTPFRFLKNEDLIDGSDRHIRTLTRACDCYKYLLDSNDPDVRALLAELRTFTTSNIYERRDDWKRLNKVYRNLDFDHEKQFMLSFCRSLYVDVECVDREFLDNYIKSYGNDEPSVEYHLDDIDYSVSDIFVNYYNSVLADIEEIPRIPRPAASKGSSMSRRKKYDWINLYKALDKFDTINYYAREAMLRCFDAIQLYYNYDMSSIRELVQSKIADKESVNLIEFLPKGTCVRQRKGKIGRFVCAGNDIFDLALAPIMKVIQTMESKLACFLPRNLSDYRSNADENQRIINGWRSGYTFSYARGKSVTIKSSCRGADSSDATEKVNGHYMFDCWRTDYDGLDEQIKSKMGLNEAYIDVCRQLLTETPFWIYNNGSYYIMFTNGTSQGQMGSWDLLNYANMKILARAFSLFLMSETDATVEQSAVFAFKAVMKSGTDGDDAVFPQEVGSFYMDELQARSLPGVINRDKSNSEDDIGYVEYASSYVKSGAFAPKMLSNLMMVSLVTDMSDPYKIQSLYNKPFMARQLRQLSPFLKYFKDLYNVKNLPMLLDDKMTYIKLSKLSYAASLIRYNNMKDILSRIDNSQIMPQEGTDVAPVRELAPCIRALNIEVRNMSLTYDKAYTIASNKAVVECYDNVGNMMREIDAELMDIADLIADGVDINQILTDLQDDDDAILRAVMKGLAIPIRKKNIELEFDPEIFERNFNCIYTGYCKNLLIKCSIKTIRR